VYPKPDGIFGKDRRTYMSVGVDYHVTRVVDGTKGVHGMIPEVDLHGAALVTLGIE